MSMKTQINTDAYGNIIVQVNGGMDFESTVPLREELEDLAENNPLSVITIDMNNLDFVGSSGIGHFVETLKLLKKSNTKLKLSNVKTEFKKVFKLYNLAEIDSLIQEFDREELDEIDTRLVSRKKTIEV